MKDKRLREVLRNSGVIQGDYVSGSIYSVENFRGIHNIVYGLLDRIQSLEKELKLKFVPMQTNVTCAHHEKS